MMAKSTTVLIQSRPSLPKVALLKLTLSVELLHTRTFSTRTLNVPAFLKTDHKLKVESWLRLFLLRPYYDNDMFELQCTILEVNFLESMSITHSYFVHDDEDPTKVIFNPVDIGNAHYDMILINPHCGINLSSFEALSDIEDHIWKSM
ncbi:hypothetical protein V6N12_024067 [Hibiscus sabdariffa]|uniref:Uncharacterized protein n=1 Tax=Hibiscus sabdariffa TaxID=183260 RepID=A0ABR2FZI0_9ROSI